MYNAWDCIITIIFPEESYVLRIQSTEFQSCCGEVENVVGGGEDTRMDRVQ